MQTRKIILMLLIILLPFFCLSCQDDLPSNVSVDGAVVEVGLEVNDDLEIVTPQTTFQANEDFYFYFYNNQPFNTERLTVQLVDGRNEKVLAEHTYEVDPGQTSLTDGIFFGNPGKYLITVRIDGIVRATREVTIE